MKRTELLNSARALADQFATDFSALVTVNIRQTAHSDFIEIILSYPRLPKKEE